jgi:hypothetical protein
MKNSYLSHLKEYFGKRYRSLTKKIKARGSTRRTSDFGGNADPYTLVLKQRTWRIEINRRNVKKFFRGHRVGVTVVTALIVALVAIHYSLTGFASTADFYPSSCLGNWDNVQSALGKPDVAPGASTFSALNSATFATSTAQMFCGNFSGDTDISQLTDKSFESANLVLSWNFIFPDINSTTVITAGGGDDNNNSSSTAGDSSSSDMAPAATSSSTQTSTPEISSDGSSTDDNSSSTIEATATTTAPTTTTTATATTNANTTATATTTISTSTVATPPAASSSTTPSTSNTDNATSAAPLPAPTTPTSTPTLAPTPDTVSSDTAPTSWLRDLIGIAYADETSSLVADTSTTIDTSTIEGVDSSTLITSTSDAQTESQTSSLPQPTPITVNTSMFQNIVVPSSTGDAVLAIVYSTDGVTWQPLVNIDSSNWQEARYPIPIHSWAELQHLQVAFVGLGATSSPQIFLDAAGVEVSYTDPPQAPPTQNIASDTVPTEAPTQSAGTPGAVIPPTPAQLPPAQALKQVFDPFAGQSCTVTPFSESVTAGGGGSFLLKLIPPVAATSSSSRKAPKAQSFIYDASIGSLPDGISATIISGNAGMDTIGVTTAANVAPGSYNVVVVYQELQPDGTTAPNFCQFNIVVPASSS